MRDHSMSPFFTPCLLSPVSCHPCPLPLVTRSPSSARRHVKHLLLWDIDGTLIASGGAGMRALQVALRTVFGIDGSLADIDFAGRTDTWIMREVFRKFNLPPSPERFAQFFEGYVSALPAELNNPQARILPGVRELLLAIKA